MSILRLSRLVLLACALIGGSLVATLPASGAPTHSHTSSATEKSAVLKALARELHRQTAGHVRVASYTVTNLDIQSGYALAKVSPKQPAGLDPVSVLMRKRKSGWTFVSLGTNMHGAGKQYGVPHSLWAKWGL